METQGTFNAIRFYETLAAMETYAEVQKNYALQRMRAKTTSEIRKKHMQNLWHSGRIPGRRRRM